LPDGNEVADDPKLQANTVQLDVLADAPYCLRPSADGTYPALPVFILFKDVNEEGVCLRGIRLSYRHGVTGSDGTVKRRKLPVPRDLIVRCADLADQNVDLDALPDKPLLIKPIRGPQGSGLFQQPWWCQITLDAQTIWQKFNENNEYLERAARHLYAALPYLALEVVIEYERITLRSSRSALRIMFTSPLPRADGWHYGDTHYHSIYTENPAEWGGDLTLTRRAADAVGLEWVFLSDHSWDFTRTKDLSYLSAADRWVPFINWVPSWQERASDERALLIPAEEITLNKLKPKSHPGRWLPERDSVSLHMLNLAAHEDLLIPDHQFFGDLTLAEALDRLDPANNHLPEPSLFAAHPVCGGYNWRDPDLDLAAARPFFHGLQVFNERVTESQAKSSANCVVYELEEGKNERGEDPYVNLRRGLEIWRDKFLLPAAGETSAKPPQRCVIVAGSDAHMDFNFAQRPAPLLPRYSFTDNAFGKVRTLAYIPGFASAADFNRRRFLVINALKRGACIITDGPIALPTLAVTPVIGEPVRLVCGIPVSGNPDLYRVGLDDSVDIEFELGVPAESSGTDLTVCLHYPVKRGAKICEEKPKILSKLMDKKNSCFTVNDLISDARLAGMTYIYFRLECRSSLNGAIIGWCCTNPIWLKII